MNTDFPILLSTGKCWVTLDEQDRWSKSWVTTGKKKNTATYRHQQGKCGGMFGGWIISIEVLKIFCQLGFYLNQYEYF